VADEADIQTAHKAGDLSKAATVAIDVYGSEVLGFLVAMMKEEAIASEVFSQFCEDLWTGLPTFRWECSFRTWAYALARNASRRYLRSPHVRKNTALSSDGLGEIAAKVRTNTASYLRSEIKSGVQRLRESLDPEDQMLLILRVDRDLSWTDVARIMLTEGEAEGAPEVASDAAVGRKAAALRKRFERVKEELKRLAQTQGLLEDT
jgi:RNA polymerase sigma-70 factor (ECF subfamily)